MQDNIIQFPKQAVKQAKAKKPEQSRNLTRVGNGVSYSCYKSYYTGYQFYVKEIKDDH